MCIRDRKIIYPHYDFKHLTEKYFEIGMKLNDFSIQLVKYCKEEAFDFQLKLIGELTALLKTNNVDLVALNDSPLLLTYNAIRDGIILKSDEPVRVRFETRIMSRYLDEQYHICLLYTSPSPRDRTR